MQKIKDILGIIIIIILTPILFVSAVILVNSYRNPNEVPSFFGWKPFIVLSGSMETQISVGDIVVVKEINDEELKKGDIIAFKDNDIVITHRIDEIIQEDGKTEYITKGDNNNAQDKNPVLPEQIEGVFKFKIERLGNLAIFVQTPLGIITCLSIPIITLLIIQVMDSRKDKKIILKNLEQQKKMEKEIEKLKKEKEELVKK